MAAIQSGLLACALTIGACGSSFDDLCNRANACEGGNDKDKQACVDLEETLKKAASDYGCSSQFQDLQNCQTATGTCTAGKFEMSCSNQQDAVNTCEQAASAEHNQGAPGH
jgi:hypothetical protein